MSLEIQLAKPGDADAFWDGHLRALHSEQWAFKVVWIESQHDVVARVDDVTVGALRARIAGSLTHIEAIYVEPSHRRGGIGRALLERCEQLANWYNCHKLSAAVMNESEALRFFLACGYHVEAVLPQHTFKLDVAMVRKFTL